MGAKASRIAVMMPSAHAFRLLFALGEGASCDDSSGDSEDRRDIAVITHSRPKKVAICYCRASVLKDASSFIVNLPFEGAREA